MVGFIKCADRPFRGIAQKPFDSPIERAITSAAPLHLIISRRGVWRRRRRRRRLTDGSRVTESAAYGIIISPGRGAARGKRSPLGVGEGGITVIEGARRRSRSASAERSAGEQDGRAPVDSTAPGALALASAEGLLGHGCRLWRRSKLKGSPKKNRK